MAKRKMKQSRMVYAAYSEKHNEWIITRSRKEAKESQKDGYCGTKDFVETVCNLSTYLGKKLSEKKIYAISSKAC